MMKKTLLEQYRFGVQMTAAAAAVAVALSLLLLRRKEGVCVSMV